MLSNVCVAFVLCFRVTTRLCSLHHITAPLVSRRFIKIRIHRRRGLARGGPGGVVFAFALGPWGLQGSVTNEVSRGGAKRRLLILLIAVFAALLLCNGIAAAVLISLMPNLTFLSTPFFFFFFNFVLV